MTLILGSSLLHRFVFILNEPSINEALLFTLIVFDFEILLFGQDFGDKVLVKANSSPDGFNFSPVILAYVFYDCDLSTMRGGFVRLRLLVYELFLLSYKFIPMLILELNSNDFSRNELLFAFTIF